MICGSIPHRSTKLGRPGPAPLISTLLAHILLACVLLAFILLGGCATFKADPVYPLRNIVIADAEGIYPYTKAIRAPIGTIPERDILFIPSQGVVVRDLPDILLWLQAYDFDGSETVDAREITHALLVQAAIWRSGKKFSPDSLWLFPPEWHGKAPLSAAEKIRGVALSLGDQQLIRDVILDVEKRDLNVREMMEQLAQQFIRTDP